MLLSVLMIAIHMNRQFYNLIDHVCFTILPWVRYKATQ